MLKLEYDFEELDRHGIGRVRIPEDHRWSVYVGAQVYLYEPGELPPCRSAVGTVQEFNRSSWVARVKIKSEGPGGYLNG